MLLLFGIEQNRTPADTSFMIILDPAKHTSGVQHFFQHYGIRPQAPSLSFLEEILQHYAGLPYENISKILKLNKHFTSLEHLRFPEEVIEDHIRFRFGGTCFSLTFFLYSILTHHGFIAYPVMADMKNRPKTHSALIVFLEKRKYLVDPGYLLKAPMEIHPDKPRLYRNAHTGVELCFNPQEERYHLYTFDAQQITWRYQFQDQPVSWEEFLKYWHDSFYQGTMHGICVTQLREDRLIYIHNQYVKIASFAGTQKRRLKKDVESVISELFGIQPEFVEQALAAIPENIKMEKKHGLRKEQRHSLEEKESNETS